MIVLISLPSHNMPLCEGMSNLNGWWKPPVYVDHFWSVACLVNCEKEDYEKVKTEVIESYLESVKQFFKENVL